MNAWTERACTAHAGEPAEAELVEDANGLTYRVLRCTRCGRPQGMRLVRRERAK